MVPFLWMGFNCLKATATSRRQFTFYHSVPKNSWYSFYRPRKDERPSRPWSHPVVLNTGLLDQESSALTTGILFPPKSIYKTPLFFNTELFSLLTASYLLILHKIHLKSTPFIFDIAIFYQSSIHRGIYYKHVVQI